MAEIVNFEVPSSKKEPATVEVNTAAAVGDGPLTAEAFKYSGDEQLEQGESCEVTVEKEDDGKYKLTFAPPSPDEYSLSIKWGDEPIAGSPLKLNLNHANSKAVSISKPPGANIRPGEDIVIHFNASKAGRGTLTGTCTAEDTGDIEVKVERVGLTSTYIVEFLPPHEDLYTLNVLWAGKKVKGSPFRIDMIPVLHSKVVASNLVVPKEPGGQIELNVCTKGAGNAKVAATCRGEKVGEIPVEINKLPDSSHDYHLTATTSSEPDKYTMNVTFAGHSIPESPFTIDVVSPGLGADGVEHLTTILPSTHDCPVIIKFDACKAGEGSFRARVNGIGCGPVDCTCEDLPDTDHHSQVTFVPPRADAFLVDVYWNDSPVRGSPFNVNIVRPERLVFGELRFVELDRPVELKVDPSEAGPGKITASCIGEKMGDIDVIVEDDDSECGDKKIISYRPSYYDSYTLLVFFDGMQVREFSLNISEPVVTPPPEPNIFIFGVDRERKAYFVGDKITFGVNASTAGEGRLNVRITGPSMSEDPPDVHIDSSEKDPHIYNIEYVPNAPGEHKIELKWNEDEIRDSPLVFTIEDSSKYPTFPITKPYKIFFATECDPKDIRAFGVHEETRTTKDLVIGKRRNGKVKLTYTTSQAGLHTISILLNGSEIRGSPFRIMFIKFDPKACKLQDLPDTAYVGEEASFKVDARKAGSGELHVRARVPVGGSDIRTRHEYDHNGFYSIFFTARVVGEHIFDVSWAGEPIFESPVRVPVEQREITLEAAKKEAIDVHVLKEDMDIFKQTLHYSRPAFICISTGHVGKAGKLSIKTAGPGEAKTNVYDRENGVYTAEIRPAVSGVYTVGIFWNDIHIRDSPFKLDFTAEKKSYLINGLDLDSVPFKIDIPHTFHLHCPQDQKRELKITCTPTTAANISWIPSEHDENSYLCEILPKEVGNHSIAILYDDCEVHNSPHNVQFDPNPDSIEEPDNHLAPLDISFDITTPLSPKEITSDTKPSIVQVFVSKLSDELIVGQEGFFTIETKEAGEGKLEIDVQGPKGAFKINVRRHPENSRTLLARYDPKAVGKYRIDISWNGEAVTGSPFNVNVIEQPNLAKVDMTIEL